MTGSVNESLGKIRADRHWAVVTVAVDPVGVPYGPLFGVPFTVKDVIATAGIRSTAGSRVLVDHVPESDAPAVARMRAAGAVLVGKTNCSELALSAWTGNPLFPETDNPVHPNSSPGGSSGGCAAAIAADLVPISLGTDYGGSVRFPAVCCGVVGLRPTPGRIPSEGQLPRADPESPRAQFSLIGPLGRTVADVSAALEVLCDDVEPAEPTASIHMPTTSPAWLRQAAHVFTAIRALDTYNDLRAIAHLLGPSLQQLIAQAPTEPDRDRRAELNAQRDQLIDAALADLDGQVLALPVADGPIPPPAGRAADPEALWPARAISLLGFPALAYRGIQLVGPPRSDEVLIATALGVEVYTG